MTITKIPSTGLEDTGVGAGTVGSASQIPVITVNAQGQVTSKSTAALDLSTKVDLDGANATGTWGGTTEWTRVNNRPTALGSFSNSTLFDTIAVDGGMHQRFTHGGGDGNTGNCKPYTTDIIGGAIVVSNCGSIAGVMAGYVYDEGTGLRFRHARWNYNCACNCDCCCCFASGTLVKMADGSVKAIEDVLVGEKVEGLAGEVTVAHKFDTTLKTNSLWELNGNTTVTGGHLFKVANGWAAIDMSAYPHGVFFRSEQVFDETGLIDVKHQSEIAECVRQLVVGDMVNGVVVESIHRVAAGEDFNVHNMIIDGGDAFVLATGAAVDGFMRQACGAK